MKPHLLITGAAGFIGTNAALYFNRLGYKLSLLDNMSRTGVEANLDVLRHQIPKANFYITDTAAIDNYLEAIKTADAILHLAGQTAVTTSLTDPSADFHSNLLSSFRLLEAIRHHNPRAIVLYASTNKVYGDLTDLKLTLSSAGWHCPELPNGVSEQAPLRFITPYGCSKGAIDQYMLDFSHSFQLRTIVFRQSCIYGPYQQGVEDQGWVAHFLKQLLSDKPITLFGDGQQVRDLLYIDDLLEAYNQALNMPQALTGRAFNIGGGPSNSISLQDLLLKASNLTSLTSDIRFSKARVGDQRWFVANTSAAQSSFNWQPTTSIAVGLPQLISYLQSSQAIDR